MRCTFLRGVAGDKVARVTPKFYRGHLPPLDEGKQYTLIIFPRERVILSGAVKHAQERLGATQESILAIGSDFTHEAREALLGANIQVVSLRDFGWIDASYQSVRES